MKILHLFSDWKWTGPAEHAKKELDGRLSSIIQFQCFSEIPSFALLEKNNFALLTASRNLNKRKTKWK